MKKLQLSVAGLAIAVCLSGCGTNPAPAPAAPAPAPAAPAPAPAAGGTTTVDAQAIYKQNCMSCHGADLSGGVGPNLQKVGSRLSADQITAQIANGKGAMPPFKGTLKDPDIAALAGWLEAHK
ncbi:cytochrome c-551 [Gordoniibacillus kamchatkensis]|uniref:Cytochrome c-551 n=1 Tax=Gordoniibacillus kamchatkensis TaxID=1590651 RepID=A0ABR5AQ40_9BACL|nr:cytochrome c [Paenibacillus sp. VKM B-2647]KIL42477.1 cytochrome c-551 [Paenibacillus sp. VKM B-2647]